MSPCRASRPIRSPSRSTRASVSALRPFPCRESGTHLHRIEIPYGRFQRRIVLPLEDPYMPLELAERRLADGVLTLTFRKKEGA
jgi:HSP20 family protein